MNRNLTPRYGLIALFILLFFNSQTGVASPSKPDPVFPADWIILQLAQDAPEFLTYQNDYADQREQMRDWFLLAAANHCGYLDSAALRDALYDFAPVRQDYLADVNNFQWGFGRWLPLPGNRLLLLTPADDSLESNNFIKRSVDRYRMTMNNIPDSVIWYEYEITNKDLQSRFRVHAVLSGSEFFKEATWGYVESRIRTPAEMEKFLQGVQDLSWFSVNQDALLLGGRRYSELPNLTVEHIQTIFRAIATDGDVFFSLDPDFRTEGVVTVLEGIASGKDAFWNKLYTDGKIRPVLLRTIDDKLQTLPYREQMEQIASDLAEKNLGSFTELKSYLKGVFDSLTYGDPSDSRRHISLDVRAMLQEVQEREMAEEREKTAKIADAPKPCNEAPEDFLISFKIKRGLPATYTIDEATWDALAAEAPQAKATLDSIHTFLSELLDAASFMRPRYSPAIRGTEVAMFMFYCDYFLKNKSYSLLSSSLRNKSLSPLNMLGNAEHWKESELYPDGRLFFTPAVNGFFRHEGQLGFAFECAQANARSSKNIFAKLNEEVPPTYLARQYTEAWAKWYDRFAAFEPMFHRLSQLMKWSLVAQELKLVNSPALRMFSSVPVRDTFVFPDWYANTSSLKLKRVVPILPIVPDYESKECLSFSDVDGGIILGGKNSLVLANVPRGAISSMTRPGVYAGKSSAGKVELLIGKNFAVEPKSISATNSENFRGMSGKRITILEPKTVYNYNAAKAKKDFLIQYSVVKSPLVSGEVRQIGPGIVEISFRKHELAPIQRLSSNITDGRFDNLSVRRSKITAAAVELPDTRSILSVRPHPGKETVFIGMKPTSPGETTYASMSWQPEHQIINFANPARVKYHAGSTVPGSHDILKVSVSDAPDFATISQNYRMATLRFVGVTERPVIEAGKDIASLQANLPAKTAPVFLLRLGRKGQPVMLRQGIGRWWVRDAEGKSWKAADIPALQSARADALRSATMSNKKARIAYLNDQGEVCMVSLKKPLSEKWESFVKSNMADAGENGVRGIVINKKAKGLKLNEENFLELPRKMTAERTQLFNDIKNLVRERGDLSPYLRNLRGNITREDIEILRQIPAENKLLLDDYLTLRDNLSASSLHKDYAAVSLRHNPDAGTPQFLLRRADQTTSVHSVDMNGKVPDFSTLSDRLESAETLNEFKKATTAEGQFISEVYKTAKCNTLITIEDASGGISSAKIAALHESLPPQGRILRDNPDLDQSVRFFKENVYPELASTVILTSSENFYFSDDMIDSLQFQRVVLKKAATYADFLAALKNPSFRQIILITESDPYEDYMDFNKEETTLSFADRTVQCREIADELRKLDHVKDYVYIRAPEAQTAQQAFARTSRVKRVIAETYFAGNPIDFLMDFLKPMMSGKASSNNSLDNILNDLTKKGVGLSRKSSFKGDFESIFRSIPDLKAEIISDKFSRF